MASQRHFSYWIGVIVGIIFIVLIAVFAFYKTRDYRSGPIITVNSPADGAQITEPLITVSGNIKNAIDVKLNGHKIFLNELGNFEEKLIVPEGYTIITVSAEDRFHKLAQTQVQVVFTK